MALAEQLRQLADQVPAPPPGDASAMFRRGVRRRRFRQGAGVTAVVAVVGFLGVGAFSLINGPTLVEFADQPTAPARPETGGKDSAKPPSDSSDITQPPALTVSASEPFPWAVAVSAGGEGRWCATATLGDTEVADVVGEPCDQLLTPEQDGNRHGMGGDGSEVQAARSGTPTQGLSWGFAPAAADEVIVLFTDGTRSKALLASGGSVDATLWAIGYEGVEVQGVEARAGGDVMAGFLVLHNRSGRIYALLTIGLVMLIAGLMVHNLRGRAAPRRPRVFASGRSRLRP